MEPGQEYGASVELRGSPISPGEPLEGTLTYDYAYFFNSDDGKVSLRIDYGPPLPRCRECGQRLPEER